MLDAGGFSSTALLRPEQCQAPPEHRHGLSKAFESARHRSPATRRGSRPKRAHIAAGSLPRVVDSVAHRKAAPEVPEPRRSAAARLPEADVLAHKIMGPRASTKRSRTPSEDEGQSTEEDSPNRVPTEGRVSPSNDDVKTYNDDERPTAVAKESDAARATRREYRRLIAEQDGFEDVPSCGRSDAKFHQGSVMVAVEGRDAWLKLLPEMMAICNEAARRQHLKNNPDAVCFDEPLSADYCYERVALAPDPLKGFIVREKKGAKRLQGFVLFHEFCGLAKSLVFDSRDPAALFGSYGSDGSVQRVFHRGNDIRTPLDLVKATDLVAEASNEDEVDRSKDDDGDLADTLTKSPRETRDAPRKDMFGGAWPASYFGPRRRRRGPRHRGGVSPRGRPRHAIDAREVRGGVETTPSAPSPQLTQA